MDKQQGKSGRRFTTSRSKRRERDEFETKLVQVDRVTRVTKGGKRMRFRAAVVVGNRKGKVGIGVMKGPDVAIAIQKATVQAKKNLIEVPIREGTIAHPLQNKYHAARVLIKPAPKGKGLKSGGAVRVVLEFAGVQNAVTKIMGSSNKINNLRATIGALKSLRQFKEQKKKISNP